MPSAGDCLNFQSKLKHTKKHNVLEIDKPGNGDSSLGFYCYVIFLYVANPFSFSGPQFPRITIQMVGQNDLEWPFQLLPSKDCLYKDAWVTMNNGDSTNSDRGGSIDPLLYMIVSDI